MFQALRAKRLCLSPEIILDDGLLLIRNGRVLKAGSWSSLKKDLPCTLSDLGDKILVPAPCNAHTHLELSHCLGKTRAGQGFLPWLSSLMENRLDNCSEEDLSKALSFADNPGHFIDTGSRRAELIDKFFKDRGLSLSLCAEVFGFADRPDLEDLLPPSHYRLLRLGNKNITASGHALYSSSLENLSRALKWSSDQGLFFSLHLAESLEEEEMLCNASGPLFDFMKERVLPLNWKPPSLRPVIMAERAGLLGPGTMAVHCVHVNSAERRILKESGTLLCLCPRSNDYIGVGKVNLRTLLDEGLFCCLGTDSLASSYDLNIWNELLFLLKDFSLSFKEALYLLSANASRLPGLSFLGTLMPGAPALWACMPEELELALEK